MVRCVNGEVQLSMHCAPVFDYGRQQASWRYIGPGYHEAEAEGDGGQPAIRLTTDMRLGFEGTRAMARTLLKEGDQRFVAMSWSEHPAPTTVDEAYDG